MKDRVASLAILAVCLAGLIGTQCTSEKTASDPGLLQSVLEKPLHWEPKHLPLLIALDTDLAGWEAAVKFGIEVWNNVVDAPIFLFGGVVDTFDLGNGGTGLLVITTAGPGADPHTYLRWEQKTGLLTAAPIRIPLNILPQLRLRVITHELGHVLGLAHDPELPQSVMFPSARGDNSGKWFVTSGDRARLLRWYNPNKLLGEITLVSSATTSSVAKTFDLEKGSIIVFP